MADVLTQDAQDDGRYFLVVRTEDRRIDLSIPLRLNGSESLDDAMRRCKDALIVSKWELSKTEKYRCSGAGIDGKPRTRFEMARAAFLDSQGNGFAAVEVAEREMIAARQEELTRQKTKAQSSG